MIISINIFQRQNYFLLLVERLFLYGDDGQKQYVAVPPDDLRVLTTRSTLRIPQIHHPTQA